MKQAGVYTILNLVTGRCYVGSSINVAHRWSEHLSKLNLGKHISADLQADWDRYGAQAFSWTLTQACETRDDAIRAEQVHIDANSDLYNASRRAGSGPPEGSRITDEQAAKISAKLKGRPKSPEHRAKLSAAKKGVPNPKLGDAIRGRKHSPEHCEKIRLGNTGKVKSAEARAKLSAALKGRVITWGAKMSASKRGKPWSEARRAALVAAQSDVEAYTQMRAKMSQSMSESHRDVPWSTLRRERWNAKHT